MTDWIKDNGMLAVEIILIVYAIAQVVVNLTPSDKDNKILTKIASYIDQLIDLLVPNLKKGGGVHNKNLILKKRKKK